MPSNVTITSALNTHKATNYMFMGLQSNTGQTGSNRSRGCSHRR